MLPSQFKLHRSWLQPGLCGALMLPSLVWIIRDRGMWSWDPAWYGETSINLWWAFSRDFSWWTDLMRHAFGAKAPGIAWFGQWWVPVGAALGDPTIGLLLGNLLWSVLALWLTALAAKEFARENFAAIAAVVFMAAAPLFVALSHQFYTEPPQTFVVAYFVWIAARRHALRTQMLFLHLLLATSLGVLAKVSTPLYVILPGLLAALALLRRRAPVLTPPSPRDRLARSATAAAWALTAVCTGGAILWYVSNWSEVRAFLHQTSVGSTAQHYGSAGPFLSKLGIWIQSAQITLFSPLALGGAIVAGAAGAAHLLRRRTAAGRDLDVPLGIVLVAQVVLPFVFFARSVNEDQRYLEPILPVLALLVGAGVRTIPLHWRVARLGVLTAFACAFLHSHAIAHGWLQRPRTHTEWLIALTTDPARRLEVQRALHLVATSTPPHTLMCGTEVLWFNANSLALHGAIAWLDDGPSMKVWNLGYAETDVARAWERLLEKQPAWYLTLADAELPQPADFLNRTTPEINQRIRNSPAFTRVPFPSAFGIELYRRSGTATP